jgi:hypothetical protein
MTPEAARRSYCKMIVAVGEVVTLSRNNGSGVPPTMAYVRARVVGSKPEELVGGIKQGDRHLIVLAEDVETSGFPVPFKTGGLDKVIVRGKALNISVVDDSTRRIAGTLIAYDITATG